MGSISKMSALRTLQSLMFTHVADAEFSRSWSKVYTAAQQISPEQPFKPVEYGRT
jgi:hypothetical protein